MRVHPKRYGVVLLLLAALCFGSGCAKYWQYRAEDLAQTFDLGVTISDDWQWAFYHSVESIVTFGYADFEADFYGWGHGQMGKLPFYLRAWGAGVYGRERFGWGGYDKNDLDTLYTQTIGIVGTPVGFISGNSNPHYVPT